MRVLATLGTLTCAVALMLPAPVSVSAAPGDEAKSIAAFETVAKVLNHPRCMNCHTTAAWPTQGDDRHRHKFNVARGPDDRGAPGMKCVTCHKDQNGPEIPGAKDWHMAPLAQGWTNLSPGALCRAVTDPKKNGNRTGAKIIEHLEADRLVLWAWTPGAKRNTPPVAHKDFLAAAQTWIKAGAHCPAP
jgi:hypothetical protein